MWTDRHAFIVNYDMLDIVNESECNNQLPLRVQFYELSSYLSWKIELENEPIFFLI